MRKNSFNRVQIGTVVYRQFSTTFAFKRSSGQWTRGSNDWVFALCECHHHILCHLVPFTSPGGLSSLIEYHFFSEPGPRNDYCPAPSLLAYRETRLAFDSHSTSLSLDPHEMSLNIEMKIIRPVNLSGVTLNLNNNS